MNQTDWIDQIDQTDRIVSHIQSLEVLVRHYSLPQPAVPKTRDRNSPVPCAEGCTPRGGFLARFFPENRMSPPWWCGSRGPRALQDASEDTPLPVLHRSPVLRRLPCVRAPRLAPSIAGGWCANRQALRHRARGARPRAPHGAGSAPPPAPTSSGSSRSSGVPTQRDRPGV